VVDYITTVAWYVGSQLAIIAPLILGAIIIERPRRLTALWRIAVIFLLAEACQEFPAIGPFADLPWNWVGKSLGIAWPFALIAITAGTFVTYSEAGITRRLARDWVALTATVALAQCVFAGASALAGPVGRFSSLGWETLLFQVAMAPLADELVYRGVLQGMANRVFERRWHVAGARVGWSTLIVALLFAAAQMVSVDLTANHSPLTISLFAGIPALMTGLLCGWLRERTGGIWPGLAVRSAAALVTFGISTLF
jgi:membrane protease YdiL (CAAX protease family)